MTGVGAIFELYTNYKESRRNLKPELSEPNLDPDAQESVQGFVDGESDWHNVIRNEDWDSLLEMIQDYDFKKYNPKEPDKPKKRLRVVGAAVWVKNKVTSPRNPEEPPVSPLLALDENGQTPLHLAIKNMAPDKYVIRMAFCERRAALIADNEGKLPLHWSSILERNTSVTDRLIRANFHHMQREDDDGNTALCYAIDKAIAHKNAQGDNQTDYWGVPRNEEDSEWQKRQLQKWAKARFILLSYSTRKKVFVQGERDLLLKVLDNAGPPELVEVCILAAQGMLKNDPTLASSTLRLFMKRHYPIKNLQLLLHHFPEENVESMEAARKLLTNYYHLGCRRLQSRKYTFREEMEKHALEGNYKRSLLCQEWWNKIKCLLRLCGHQNSKSKKEIFDNNYLLHAALANSDTPPSLVQLLMVMNPPAMKLCHPFNHSLLVHQICRNWKYNLYPHSKKIGVQIDIEEPPMEQVLKIILATDETLTRKRYHNRLPLHDAISTSKSIAFLDALIQKDRRSLSVRDPVTKLYPFQMAALGNLNKNAAFWAHARYSPNEWKALEPEDRAWAVDEVIEEQKAEQLSTIYHVLRQFPGAVAPKVAARKAHEFRDTNGKGMISAHYLLLTYVSENKVDYVPLDANRKLIEDAISLEEIPRELEAWWAKLKFWIRYCYKGELNLPNEDEFLLHAAAANPDVPPLLIELIVAIFPHSVAIPVSGNLEYPLHIAAATPKYEAQPFEQVYSKSTIQVLFEAYPKAATVLSPSGTPYDVALAKSTRSEDEMKILRGEPGSSHYLDISIQEEEIDMNGVGLRNSTSNQPCTPAPPQPGMIPSECLVQDKREAAALRLQAAFRGSMARTRVSGIIDELISQMEKSIGSSGEKHSA